MTIQSFRCKHTKKLYEGKRVAKFANLIPVAERKLQLLDSAASLEFLRSPPGNHLEGLGGDRQGQHSIRINDQFRLCFTWTEDGPVDVEIVDYH
ncbi:type II toxin-antitoxin system RelE/ParE family toxin [Massilia cavernae]|uniref:Excinuclease ABC subunit A n=1 Tax=Massilia cavernae TaxID=2320864 RepID=A0A418Y7J2_9BURK|nr:type II toxin-antitoxin system RelE/ParE family toxin [Massilia cavernae]RJG25878.1 excinuclease ABC subunit A [Massilia cavernae]